MIALIIILACNRCCDEFDHHCNWLNNCIGRANYAAFMALIIVFWIYVAFYVAVSSYVVWSINEDKFISQSSLEKLYKHDISRVTEIFIYVLMVFNLCVLLLSGHLISFHIWLHIKGITTFDHIVYNREKKQKLLELKKGEISIEEYKDWELYASPKKIMRKSKIITQVKSMGDETPDKDMSSSNMKEVDITQQRHESMKKDEYNQKAGVGESMNNPILQYELDVDHIRKDHLKLSGIQHLQTGLDHTKGDSQEHPNFLVAEKYIKKPVQQKQVINTNIYNEAHKSMLILADPAKAKGQYEQKYNEEFKMIYDYEERKISEKYDQDSHSNKLNGAKSNMDFELTDVAGGKSTQTGFYKQNFQQVKNVKFEPKPPQQLSEQQRKKIERTNSLLKSNDGKILPISSSTKGYLNNGIINSPNLKQIVPGSSNSPQNKITKLYKNTLENDDCSSGEKVQLQIKDDRATMDNQISPRQQLQQEAAQFQSFQSSRTAKFQLYTQSQQ
ncbi:dhhc zinc finger domain containing protein [Stylonychia lemnae]|uniref:Palmitoyltransferase n=1 Tax=Stylonychia lemnae TaxID=5949 RepID=A0A078AW68_STYLE|nr:dhhc zinc finger domain containing protein [Stylonychia lemnae]|eukprot:CDW85477.1 dhhc zinc finger domain containing protein [Stylonychia lemnae]